MSSRKATTKSPACSVRETEDVIETKEKPTLANKTLYGFTWLVFTLFAAILVYLELLIISSILIPMTGNLMAIQTGVKADSPWNAVLTLWVLPMIFFVLVYAYAGIRLAGWIFKQRNKGISFFNKKEVAA